jgi:hypothetical protein
MVKDYQDLMPGNYFNNNETIAEITSFVNT